MTKPIWTLHSKTAPLAHRANPLETLTVYLTITVVAITQRFLQGITAGDAPAKDGCLVGGDKDTGMNLSPNPPREKQCSYARERRAIPHGRISSLHQLEPVLTYSMTDPVSVIKRPENAVNSQVIIKTSVRIAPCLSIPL
jgi:hypothetical protein